MNEYEDVAAHKKEFSGSKSDCIIDRQTDRRTDRQRDRGDQTHYHAAFALCWNIMNWSNISTKRFRLLCKAD